MVVLSRTIHVGETRDFAVAANVGNAGCDRSILTDWPKADFGRHGFKVTR
ncbi:hypothetical protein [Pseudophaeobacter sp. EL27]|nr:hypothetical protein [Pseudophaeobacter sp. EL27]